MKVSKTLWEKILKSSNKCGCNKTAIQIKAQNKVGEHQFILKSDQKKVLMDQCGNPLKINLITLKKILEVD